MKATRYLTGSILALCLLLQFCVPVSASGRNDEEKTLQSATVAVFDFDDRGGQAPGIGRAVADMLITRLARNPLFRVYERARLEEIAKEQQRAGGGNKDPKIQAAETLGVQFVLIGKVTEFGVSDNSVMIPGAGNVTKYKARAALDIRLVQVSDGKVLETWNTDGAKTSYNMGINILGIPNFSFTGKEFDQSLLGQAAREAVEEAADLVEDAFKNEKIQEMIESFPLSGRVADVENGEIILNVGEIAGVVAGMVMDVFRVEKEIKDPETGKLLTERTEKIGEIIITHIEDNYSEGNVISLQEGRKVEVNDRVIEQTNLSEEEEPE